MSPTSPVDTNDSIMRQSHDMSWFPFNIPREAWQVQDADEEIFLLYSQLQSSGHGKTMDDASENASSLGSVDSRQGQLVVRIDVQHSCNHDDLVMQPGPLEERPEPSHSRASKRSRASPKKRDRKSTKQEPLEINLFQDTTALRSRKGDTGSVLWRASVQLARSLLSQPSSPDSSPLLLTSSLASCHVLELGSGTGLLSIVLAPHVAHYTATDLPPLLPLIRKNLEHNLPTPQRSKVTVDDIDWVELHNTPTHLRHKFFPTRIGPYHLSHAPHERSTTRRTTPAQPPASGDQNRHIDLIIAVDCIYNPTLIAPLLDTINYLATPSHPPPSEARDAIPDVQLEPQARGSPTVLVVLELRAADVSRDFLHAWLELPGNWEIWSVPGLGARFAVWVGRQRDGSR